MSDELTTAIYQIVRLVPRGRATSYGAIARAVGLPAGARQVGRIMGRCPEVSPESKEYVPAHRVVGAGGVLTASGAFGGTAVLTALLQGEGIQVRGNRIREWKKVFWDPLTMINDIMIDD